MIIDNARMAGQRGVDGMGNYVEWEGRGWKGEGGQSKREGLEGKKRKGEGREREDGTSRGEGWCLKAGDS